MELTRRRYHQTRRPCCTRAKRINGVFENARFGVGFNFHVIRQAGEAPAEVHQCLPGHFGIVVLLSFRMDLQARVASYAILSRRAKAANMRASGHGVAPSLRIWPITTKKRGSRERSSPPCQIRTLILPRAERRAAILLLTLTTDPKVLRTLAPRWREPYGSRLRTIKRFSRRL